MTPAILKPGPTDNEFIETLNAWHVTHVFVVPGAQIDPLIKALAASPSITTIVANHELTAGYMADGYARACGGIGVAMSIGGPDSAKLIGAAVSAFADPFASALQAELTTSNAPD